MTEIQIAYIHKQMNAIIQAIQAGMPRQDLISYIQQIEKQLTSSVEEPAFNYDLERMKAHVECGGAALPKNIRTADEIEKWLLQTA